MGPPLQFFYFNSSSSLTVTKFDTPSDCTYNYAIAQALREQIIAGDAGTNQLSWHPVLMQDRAYILQLYSQGENYIASWVSTDCLFALFSDVALTENGHYLLLDADNNPLTGQEIWDQYKNKIEGTNAFSLRGDKRCFLYDFPVAGLQVLVVDKPFVDRSHFTLLMGFILFVLLVITAFSAYTLYYFYRNVQAPLKFVEGDIQEYEKSRKAVKYWGFAELEDSVEVANALAERINNIKIDSYEEKLALAKTELEYFQLQIKPHFFLNCFSILFGMAQKKDFARIQEFCEKLSNYVRYLFTDGFSMVEVQKELSLVGEYLQIQNIRYRSDFQVDGQLDESLYDAVIPPLLILTFVENSIKHSKCTAHQLKVHVEVSLIRPKGGEKLQLCIQDNGVGFAQGQLADLNQIDRHIFEARDTAQNIGIHNIYQRLCLLYGSHFTLEFSNLDKGCQVKILIPYKSAGMGREG